MYIKIPTDGITKVLKGFEQRATIATAWLNRVAYPMLIQVQRERWMTENASQGAPWKPINNLYAAYKVRRYGGGVKYKWIGGKGPDRPWKPAGNWPSYKGGGRKLLIATGKLVDSITGDGAGHRKIVSANKLTIGTSIKYAEAVSEVRPFNKLSYATRQRITQEWNKYVKGDS